MHCQQHLKKIETGDLEDSTGGKEASEGYCNTQAHTERDMASARKRFKVGTFGEAVSSCANLTVSFESQFKATFFYEACCVFREHP